MSALAFPSVGIQHINMRLRRTVAVSQSPFTYDTQVHLHQGARWEAEITLPPLSYDEARSVEAFIVALKGRSGTFTFGHPLHTSTATGNVSANADIRAETLTLGGSSTAIDAGTYFQVGDYLYIVTTGKSAGAGDISIQPPLRAAVSSGTTLDFTLPKSTWRLASNDVGFATDSASMYGFTFACVEAL